MRRLLLLRHAKAVQPGGGMIDRDRPLTSRGRRDAGLVGAKIASDGLLPDLVLCSPSQRTRDTLADLGPEVSEAAAVVFAGELYEPTSGDYIPTMAERGDDARFLLVIGHNPAIQRTALSLIGKGKRDLTKEIAAKFPTCALAVVEFERGAWSALSPHSGRLTAFIKPRALLPSGEAEEFDD